LHWGFTVSGAAINETSTDPESVQRKDAEKHELCRIYRGFNAPRQEKTLEKPGFIALFFIFSAFSPVFKRFLVPGSVLAHE
jgi:hypothetical protein